jgi:hypothetical protein
MSGRKAMRAAAVTAVLTVVSLGAAQADRFYFKDILLPGGHARSDAVLQADEHRCGADANCHFGNVVAFKKCMRAHGWVTGAYEPNSPSSHRDPRLNPGDDYISADTGMSCKDVGGIGICGPPHGTVHYRNENGENCTRTGLVSICD